VGYASPRSVRADRSAQDKHENIFSQETATKNYASHKTACGSLDVHRPKRSRTRRREPTTAWAGLTYRMSTDIPTGRESVYPHDWGLGWDLRENGFVGRPRYRRRTLRRSNTHSWTADYVSKNFNRKRACPAQFFSHLSRCLCLKTSQTAVEQSYGSVSSLRSKHSEVQTIDYRCDIGRFWLSAHNCQVSTPTSQNLEIEQQIQYFGSWLTHQLLGRLKFTIPNLQIYLPKKANSEKLGLGIDNPCRIVLWMNKCLERVNDRHFWNPGVFSYTMIPKVFFHRHIYSLWCRLGTRLNWCPALPCFYYHCWDV
jgi:hypothetical protein